MFVTLFAMLMLAADPPQQPGEDAEASPAQVSEPIRTAEQVQGSSDSTRLPDQLPVPPLDTRIEQPVPRRATRIIPFTSFTTAFDSNVNRDTDDLDSLGAVAGLGVTFKDNPLRPTFEVQYEAGFHQYSNTNRWDRVSHQLRAAWERRLTRRFYFEQVGEVTIKGSTEDHELSNQGTLSPRLEYRFVRWLRLRAIGAWRVKRYDDTPDRNAFNRYAGLELIGRHASGLRWTVGARAELNATVSPRQRYERRTWYIEFSTPLTKRDRIELASTYRRQRYPYRLVDVAHGPDVLRRDARVEPAVEWLHTLSNRVELRLGYGFDGRDSNDTRRDYRSHQGVLGIVTRW
jgi:hypothetical protein